MGMIAKFLDPKNDFLFKRLFGTEKNKDILIYFINNILHLEGRSAVQDVTYLKTIQDKEVAYKKQSIVDVLCKDQDGVQFVIEMQVSKTPGFEERAQYYAAKAYTSQMYVGGKYKDLKEVIFIAISNYIMFPKKEDWKSSHVTLDIKTQEQDLKAFSFTFIELPKFDKTIDALETVEEKWIYFFKNAHETTEEDFNKFIGNDSLLKKAFDETTRFSMTEEEWNTYEESLRIEMDNKAVEEQKLMEAEEKGMEKGKADGIKLVAINMLKAGLSLKIVSQTTGLSEKEILALS